MMLLSKPNRLIVPAGLLFLVCLIVYSSASLGSQHSKVVQVSEDELMRSATKRVQPSYTDEAKLLAIGNKVIVEVTVDEEGKVVSARPLSGDPILRQRAVEAAREWRFVPTRLGGGVVKVVGRITFDFLMKGRPPADHKKIESLKQIVQAHPGSFQAHYKLAKAYQENFLLLEAIDEYIQAIKYKPNFAEAFFELGEIYRDQDDYEKSIEAFKQAILYKLEYVEAYYGLGWSYEKSNCYKESIQTWNEVIKIKPGDLVVAQRAYINIASAYKRLESDDDLIKTYEELIKVTKQLSKKDPDSLAGGPYLYAKYIADIYEKKGRHKEAEEAYRESMALSSNESEKVWAYSELGAFYEKHNRDTEAIKTYTEAASLYRGWPKLHRNLGLLYLKTGNKLLAEKEYLILQNLAPDMASELKKKIDK